MDKLYNNLYEKYKDKEYLYYCGYFEQEKDISTDYLFSLDTTLVDKNYKTGENNIVLVTTGGFTPLHKGHLEILNEAKKYFESKGDNVLCAYICPCSEVYVKNKKYYSQNLTDRLNKLEESIKLVDWVKVDKWESLHKFSLNISESILRIDNILINLYKDRKIKIAYVFGEDNRSFLGLFEDTNYYGICVKRDKNPYISNSKYDKRIQTLLESNDNIIEINKNKFRELESVKIRKYEGTKNLEIKKKKIKENYYIRNEGSLSIQNIYGISSEELDEFANLFYKEFLKIIKKATNNKYNMIGIDVRKQLYDFESYKSKNRNKKIISLDNFIKGDYNLNVSRVFLINDNQDKPLKLSNSPDSNEIDEQIRGIKDGKYILVDDDSVSGNTIKMLNNSLPKEVVIEDIHLLANSIDTYFDIVDMRDFIIGSSGGGLVIKYLKDEKEKCIRLPYLYPYINLYTRASIPYENIVLFTVNVLNLNKDLLYRYGIEDTELPQYLKGFMEDYYGIRFTTIIEYIDFHLRKLV